MRGYILIVLMMICQPIGCRKLSPLTKEVGSVAEFHRKVVINLIIDQRGYAEIDGIEAGSGDIDVDRKALSIAEMIAKNEFVPAKQRGFEVRSYYSLVIKL